MAVICSGLTSWAIDQPAHRVHRRMAEHAARIRLDRHARAHDRVRIPELANDPIGVEPVAEAEDLEESPRRIQRVVAAGKALRGQLRGDDAVLRRPGPRAAASSSSRSSRGCPRPCWLRSPGRGPSRRDPGRAASPMPPSRRTCRPCPTSGSPSCSDADGWPRRSCTPPRSR